MIFSMLSLLGLVPTFQKAKCKKLLNTTMERIKLLRSRREAQLRQLRIDVAKLLQLGKEQKAQLWIGRICKELCLLSVYIKISAYCESVQANLKDIAGQSECPSDLEEPLAGLCFAASCCADLPELQELREIFVMKYGKRFVIPAQELEPGRVNREFLDCLFAKDLPDHRKQALLEEIIAQYKLKQGNEQMLRQQQEQETHVIMDATIECKQSPVEHEEVDSSTTVLEARNDIENVQEEADGVQESVAVSTVRDEDLGTAGIAQELANRKKASEGRQTCRSAFKRACKKGQQAWLNKSNDEERNNVGKEAGMKATHAHIRDESDISVGEASKASQGEVTTALMRRPEGHVVLYVKQPSFTLPPQRPPPPPPPPNRAPPPPVPSRAPPPPPPLRTISMPSSQNIKHVSTAYAGASLPLCCSTMAKYQYNESYNGIHVHPRLPKYEDLVANFTALKQ